MKIKGKLTSPLTNFGKAKMEVWTDERTGIEHDVYDWFGAGYVPTGTRVTAFYDEKDDKYYVDGVATGGIE